MAEKTYNSSKHSQQTMNFPIDLLIQFRPFPIFVGLKANERVWTRLYRDLIKVLRPMKIHPQFHEVGIGMLHPEEGVGRVRLKVDRLGLAMVLAFHLMSIYQYHLV
jgi:hypothetical protein